jgi:hypothetical protein
MRTPHYSTVTNRAGMVDAENVQVTSSADEIGPPQPALSTEVTEQGLLL